MTRKELEKKTIASLRSLAKGQGVRLRPSLKKKEIIDLLLPLFQDEERTPEVSGPGSKAVLGAEGKKEDAPALAGHAGEGEVHDEKVLFSSSPAFQQAVESPYSEIPREYGENRIVLLVRDPEWVYAYWEVTPDALGDANRRAGDPEARLTLRVYDVTEAKDLTSFWDIELYQRIGNWYIEVGRPERTYLVDIGMKSRAGTFATIARSNTGQTPPNAPSPRFDEEWWTVEWDREVVVAPFDEGRRLPPVQAEADTRAGGSYLLPGSLLRKQEA